MHGSDRRERRRYRERALVESARRLRTVPPRVTLDMAADLIDSLESLRDAGETAVVRRGR